MRYFKRNSIHVLEQLQKNRTHLHAEVKNADFAVILSMLDPGNKKGSPSIEIGSDFVESIPSPSLYDETANYNQRQIYLVKWANPNYKIGFRKDAEVPLRLSIYLPKIKGKCFR